MQGSDQVGHSNVCKVGTKWVTLMCATHDQKGHFNVGPPYRITCVGTYEGLPDNRLSTATLFQKCEYIYCCPLIMMFDTIYASISNTDKNN